MVAFRMTAERLSRRAFLAGCLASLAAAQAGLRAGQRDRAPGRDRDERLERFRLRQAGAHLRARFRDLPGHVVFEYYPWYGVDPWRHWDDGGRTPPARIASNYLPALGAYDSRSARVIEQHARWIVESGARAINLSWWGQGSFEDRAVPLVMDVMRDHDIRVTFHLEPYAADRATRLAGDITYLLRQYGERRRWDTFLLLERADGSAAPVMKLFGSILPPTFTDCLGVRRAVPDHVPDAVWREQTTRLRREIGSEFEQFTLLADSLDVARTRAGGFDGGTSGDPYFHPDRWPEVASWFNAEDLLIVFAVNAGFDAPGPVAAPGDPCYAPPRADPLPDVDWSAEEWRALVQQASALRIADSFERTLSLQIDRRSTNERRGFFLVYVNSFNEWHEGTQFEPMKPYAQLAPAERATYHNGPGGQYRLETLGELMAEIR
ncbi:MAG: hypothetical protein HYU53_15850 [Acidobacteria bacterium]|nr:hypothetical protein [Acidobacteriota bacterium]